MVPRPGTKGSLGAGWTKSTSYCCSWYQEYRLQQQQHFWPGSMVCFLILVASVRDIGSAACMACTYKIVQKQGPEQPISRKRHAVHQLSRGASAETTGQEMTMKAEIMCRHGRRRGHQPSYEANPKQERWTRPPMQRRTGQLTRGAP